MMPTAPIITDVVQNDLCIGCGVCAAMCPSDALRMEWNPDGFLVANQVGQCDRENLCIKVCPFNPAPASDVRTENEISQEFLPDAPKHDGNVGRYYGFYAGYSVEHRATSSSGGLATWLCGQLLDQGLVSAIISVREATSAGAYFEYSVAHTPEDARRASRTRYFPVTLEQVLKLVREQDGAVAVVGVACFVKAIRLAQKADPALSDKIRFVIGIICGGVKSRFFTEYLSGFDGTRPEDVATPEYRVKDPMRPASDYSFSHVNAATGARREIRMRLVGDMWGTGLFKANACDLCDDVTTELADISLGDAWLEPYVSDGRGCNVLVVRSAAADRLVQQGMVSGGLSLEALALDSFKGSQQGSFNHRQLGMPTRVKLMGRRGQVLPPKRFEKGKVHLDFKVVQVLRRVVRSRSLTVWRNQPSVDAFNRRMAVALRLLRIATRINGRMKGLRRRLGRGMQ